MWPEIHKRHIGTPKTASLKFGLIFFSCLNIEKFQFDALKTWYPMDVENLYAFFLCMCFKTILFLVIPINLYLARLHPMEWADLKR